MPVQLGSKATAIPECDLGIKILLAITSEEISSLIENLRSGYPYKGSLIDVLKIQSTENRNKTNTKYCLGKNSLMDKVSHRFFESKYLIYRITISSMNWLFKF